MIKSKQVLISIVHANHSFVKNIVIILIISEWQSVVIVISMEIVQN